MPKIFYQTSLLIKKSLKYLSDKTNHQKLEEHRKDLRSFDNLLIIVLCNDTLIQNNNE